MNIEELETILTKLQTSHRLYQRFQEEELKVEHQPDGQFEVTESFFMGERHIQRLDAEALKAFLNQRFSTIKSIERLLLPKQK